MARQRPSTRVPTRERLLLAATKRFATDGFEGTTVGEIEADVGLVPRRGTLYKHFASKEALLAAVIDARVEEADAFVDNARVAYDLDISDLTSDDVGTLVREFGRSFLEQLDRHRDLTRIVEHDGERFPWLADRIRREVIEPGYRAVSDALERLAPPGTDGPAHAALLLTALTGLRRTAWTFGSNSYPIDDERALDAWATFCLAVLRPAD